MMFILRIVAILLSGYFLYIVYLWWKENYSPEVPCPNCDGDGKWEMEMNEVDCLLCKGSGKIDREY